MACSSCKKKAVPLAQTKGFVESVDMAKEPIGLRILLFLVKTIIFAISLVIVPIVVLPFSIYMLFKVIYFNQSVDVTTGLVNVGRMLVKDRDDDDDDDDDDIDDFDPEDLELMDVEDITDERRD